MQPLLSRYRPQTSESEAWCDLRLEDEVPLDQRAYVRKTVERLMLCRDPSAGYARYICPGCGHERRVPFSCKTRYNFLDIKLALPESSPWVTMTARNYLCAPRRFATAVLG